MKKHYTNHTHNRVAHVVEQETQDITSAEWGNAALGTERSRNCSKPAKLWNVGSVETLTTSAQSFPPPAGSIRKGNSEWWTDRSRKHISMSLPIYALRDVRRPGIGKFTDLGRIYRDVLARQGIDTLILLPPFQATHISPYSPVSVYALNELYIDWTMVPEITDERLMRSTCTTEDPRWIHYEDEFDRAEKLRLGAYREFIRTGDGFRRLRFQEFIDNQTRNRNWLNEYAWLLAERDTNGSDILLRKQAAESRMFAQWVAYNQFRDAIDEVHIAGGYVVIDIPMFRACGGVDTSRHSEYFRSGHPGAGNQIWGDQSLWNWDKLRSEKSQYLLAPTEHWLDFGCDGARVDAAANAFRREGQSGGGDENGETFVADLAKVFHDRGALPLVEVLSAPDVTEVVERHGMLALYRDWQVYSTHDFINTDLSRDSKNFLEEVRCLLRDTDERRGWNGALFVNITFLDVEGDPFRVKWSAHENGKTVSIWETQMSLPTDPDYQNRSRWDRGFSLACVVSEETGRLLPAEPFLHTMAILPRVVMFEESSPMDRSAVAGHDALLGDSDEELLARETDAYLTRGNGFYFQQVGISSPGWLGVVAGLTTLPESIIAHHLASGDIERYVHYIERLIPQAEPIQAWVSRTFKLVDTPAQLRVWATRFEEQLRKHARRRVEAWRRHVGVDLRDGTSSVRLCTSPLEYWQKTRAPERRLNSRHRLGVSRART